MAWNSEKKRYECDRCGKPISCTQTLCKECDEWLKEYKRKRRGMISNDSNIQRNGTDNI